MVKYEKITVRPLLGHSGKAVKLPKGASLSYDFYCDKSGDARFTIAVIPCFLNAVKDILASAFYEECPDHYNRS